jgi:hypothetical protein
MGQCSLEASDDALDMISLIMHGEYNGDLVDTTF